MILKFAADVVLIAPGGSGPVEVKLTAARANSTGTLQLELPAGWQAAPKTQPFHLAHAGDSGEFKFSLTAPPRVARVKIGACAEIKGAKYRNERETISYTHIPPQLLQPQARLWAVSLDLANRAHKIGYLPGAGDSLAENLTDMGCTVKMLDDNLTADSLRDLDAVIIGVRAFNVRQNIATALPALFEYVKNGGTVIGQYNRPDKLKADKVAPYDLKIAPDRVTDETAKVTFVAPDSPLLNTPNKITSADFDGWVQERGIYFPNKWDEHFTPVLAMGDPGEAQTKGALLVAQYGKGYYIYTGLVFFRQLPAGVPGAYRLFANMISIGK